MLRSEFRKVHFQNSYEISIHITAEFYKRNGEGISTDILNFENHKYNTPGTRVGQGGRDRPQAVKSTKNT